MSPFEPATVTRISRQNATQNILYPASSIAGLEENGPRMIKGAKGIHVEDGQGNRLIDGIAGLWCANIGHGRDEIAETMAEAARRLDYFHTFGGHSNDAQVELAERLTAMAPGGLSQVFFGCTGSDANDTLVKIAWQYHITRGKPGKRKIIAREQAYHGTSIATASLTGLRGFHRDFHLPLDFALHTDCPHHYAHALTGETEAAFTARLLANLEALIAAEGADNIAAFIGEPIMGAGGVITPPEGYWAGVQEICRRNDILVIADEVVCGFGRTGHNFGSDLYGIKPDLMATAKGLTAGVFPMSAAFITAEIHDVLRKAQETLGGFSHGYTYSGHPIGAAVANKVLDIMAAEKLTENAAHVGSYLHQRMRDELGAHPHVGEIRGAGLVLAVQLMADRDSKTFLNPADKVPFKVSEACYRHGLIIRPLPSVGALALSPPLVLTKAEADDIITQVKAGLDEIFGPA